MPDDPQVAAVPRRPDNLARVRDPAARGAQTSSPEELLRPSVDIVVPFAGTPTELEAVCRRMATIRLRPGDSLVVVDNTPDRVPEQETVDTRSANGAGRMNVTVLRAAERRTPAFARNQGAAIGSAEWLVFIDADAAPSRELLDRYFDPPPGPRTALIGGGVIDEQVPADASIVARYAYLRGVMSQQRTFDFGAWGYPKSANIACRRVAFEAVGGFREEIRAAEDADLTYRLRAAGWELERRESASVVHFSRHTLRGLVKQQLVWGSGGAWIERIYPGSIPLAKGSGLIRWAVTETARGLLGARKRDRDATIYALLRPVEALSWELGRLISNERGTASSRGLRLHRRVGR
jgi:GT2 family glycosyltransferase